MSQSTRWYSENLIHQVFYTLFLNDCSVCAANLRQGAGVTPPCKEVFSLSQNKGEPPGQSLWVLWAGQCRSLWSSGRYADAVLEELKAKSIDACRTLDAEWTVCTEVQGHPPAGEAWPTLIAEALEGSGSHSSFPFYPCTFPGLLMFCITVLSSPCCSVTEWREQWRGITSPLSMPLEEVPLDALLCHFPWSSLPLSPFCSSPLLCLSCLSIRPDCFMARSSFNSMLLPELET